MGKYFLQLLALLALSFIIISWGATGHSKINSDASLSYNSQMTQFNTWTTILATHASDADYRKDTDPTEAPKHYIDIDSYDEFNETGKIPQTLDSVITLYGNNFVYNVGILPWATITAYDSLKSCFLRNDWTKAVLFTADLGHYVADGHMPLHITTNYNGQNTGNYGIHSRYESTMIDEHIEEITYTGNNISQIYNINQYIFNYLYNNYNYVDSILATDNYAKSISGNTNSYAYKQALWNKSKYFTILLFKNASHVLTELIYTAWTEAGSPPMPPFIIINPTQPTSTQIISNYPNPFSNKTTIKYSLPKDSRLLLEVLSCEGKKIATLYDGFQKAGTYQLEWFPNKVPAGVYLIQLKTPLSKRINKTLLIR